jgi:hypothetical protein
MRGKADGEGFESVTQALGALDWTLARVVFNVRARTAVALGQHLVQAGIEVPDSVIDSPKWFRAFHGPLYVASHEDGFGGLLRDRLVQLGFEEDAVRETIDGLQREIVDLCLDVESAVAIELRCDLEDVGVRVPPSILGSGVWRNVLTRDQGKLPPAAASIVKSGIDSPVFRPVE